MGYMERGLYITCPIASRGYETQETTRLRGDEIGYRRDTRNANVSDKTRFNEDGAGSVELEGG